MTGRLARSITDTHRRIQAERWAGYTSAREGIEAGLREHDRAVRGRAWAYRARLPVADQASQELASCWWDAVAEVEAIEARAMAAEAARIARARRAR